MLKVTITSELWDNEDEVFVYDKFELQLEHSLVALSKWESKYKKAFLGPKEKTPEEILGYIEAMHVGPEIPPGVLDKLSEENVLAINDYLDDKMTATTFASLNQEKKSKEIITSEVIYYWITSYQIPWEVERWHLNRLFTLIKVFNAKNEKPKKMSSAEAMEQRRRLNEERRAKLGTSG